MKRIALTILALALFGMGLAQTGNHWTPISGTQYNMTVNGIIIIDGVAQTNGQLEIGAFCGDECRGSRLATLFPPTGEYIVPIAVVSNVTNGETITFRIYDHDSQQELDLISETTLAFVVDTNVGTMNDWFQIIFTTPGQTFNLPIAGYGNSAGGYYLIAPPIDNVDPATVAGMTQGDYDLFYFDQNESEWQWRNYHEEPFYLESGMGYLYAHKTDVTLSFTGVPYNGNGQVILSKTEGTPLSGWNLVGNPFPQTATIDRHCYVMNADGTEIIVSDTRTVSPMQGVFVIAENDGETMSFSPENTTDDGARLVVDVLQGRGASKDAAPVDRAILRFEDNGTLPKLMLNPENTRVYIPQDGTDYAVVGCNVDNATPVNFKASSDGSYTLSFDMVNLNLDYLHLVDNKTGEDVDLLQTPNYTFQALATDYAERFQLVYVDTIGINEGNRPFAYYANGNIIITADACDASLQVVDATGRVLVCRDAPRASVISTAGMAPGVYMLRLIIGDDVKVQKIVVR